MMEDNWIRFDPEDQKTWPPLDKLVLTVSRTGSYSLSKLTDWKYGEGGFKWYEPDIGGVGPIDCEIAWHPLPEPYERAHAEPMGTWLFNAGDYTCSECGETFSDELFYISRSREPGLPGHCPGCGFPMKTKEAKQ